MDNTETFDITIKLTKKQFHVVSETARQQHRTNAELAALWLHDGFDSYRYSVEYYVKKLEEDKVPEKGEYQSYSLEEQDEIFKNLVFQQR